MFKQLQPQIPMRISENPNGIPTGGGVAIAVIDYSEEHNLMWVVALNESGEIWCVSNSFVRMQENRTAGRPADTN